MATIDRFLQRNKEHVVVSRSEGVSSTSPTIPIGLHRAILQSPA
jgi:hypothetical protein